jgi:hypothetical protein
MKTVGSSAIAPSDWNETQLFWNKFERSYKSSDQRRVGYTVLPNKIVWLVLSLMMLPTTLHRIPRVRG